VLVDVVDTDFKELQCGVNYATDVKLLWSEFIEFVWLFAVKDYDFTLVFVEVYMDTVLRF
jgi:hypothetical protein